jgi:hypothetical protein
LPTNPDTINNNVNNNIPLIARDNRLQAPYYEWTSVYSSDWTPKLRLGPTTTTQSGPIGSVVVQFPRMPLKLTILATLKKSTNSI